MAAIIRFITVIQKILIIICILCFIPTSVFVFAPRDHTFTTSQLDLYNHAYQQVYTPFIIGYNNNNCTYRADANNYKILFNESGCTGYSYQFDGLLFCSGLTQDQGGVINNLFQNITSSTATFTHNDSYYPIFTVSPPFTAPTIAYYHYRPDYGHDYCKFLGNELTNDIQSKISKQYYKPYQDSSRLLWFSILPILAFLIGMTIINQISNKFNLRKYIIMSCFAVNIGLITLIIKGITHFSDGLKIKSQILLFSGCFVKQEASNLSDMSNVDFGVGFGFLFFMGIVMLLIFLSMALQLVAKILEQKYYKVRDQPSSVDIQLSDLKQSLRSRRINNNQTSNPKKNSFQSSGIDQF